MENKNLSISIDKDKLNNVALKVKGMSEGERKNYLNAHKFTIIEKRLIEVAIKKLNGKNTSAKGASALNTFKRLINEGKELVEAIENAEAFEFDEVEIIDLKRQLRQHALRIARYSYVDKIIDIKHTQFEKNLNTFISTSNTTLQSLLDEIKQARARQAKAKAQKAQATK